MVYTFDKKKKKNKDITGNRVVIAASSCSLKKQDEGERACKSRKSCIAY